MKPHIRLAQTGPRGVWICYVPEGPWRRFYPCAETFMGVGTTPRSAYTLWKNTPSRLRLGVVDAIVESNEAGEFTIALPGHGWS